jgi:hypothetical protein
MLAGRLDLEKLEFGMHEVEVPEPGLQPLTRGVNYDGG